MATSSPSTHAQTGPALDNRRMAAAAIDLAAPALAGVVLYAADLLTPAVALVLVGWVLYYFFALESSGGQTVGKRAMNLKVVTAQGGDPTMQQYGVRTLARVVDMPIIGLGVMLATGDKRQRLGDIAAHTEVVDAAAAPAADAFDVADLQVAPAPPDAKRSRRTLGGPELKLPSFKRSKAAKAPKSPKPQKEKKAGRPTLGGPEIKLPSLRRRKKEPVFFEPEPETPEPFTRQPEPEPPAPAPPAPAPPAPEPSVEVVGQDRPVPAIEEPEPPAPSIMEGDAPEVEVVPSDVTPDQPPAPEPLPPSIPAVPAIEPEPPAEEPLPAAAQQPPGPAEEPEPQHVDGVRDDGSSRVNVKPIETVSAMDLLMRDAQDQDGSGT